VVYLEIIPAGAIVGIAIAGVAALWALLFGYCAVIAWIVGESEEHDVSGGEQTRKHLRDEDEYTRAYKHPPPAVPTATVRR
jgi:hypothetical protein